VLPGEVLNAAMGLVVADPALWCAESVHLYASCADHPVFKRS
jgi:hypothetical protein